MEQNLFEQATRQKLRFPTPRGQCSVEDLWDMPLLSRDGFNLNESAKTVNLAIKGKGEDFVPRTVKPSAEDTRNELRLEVLKYIIGVKVEEQEAAKARAEKAERREKLVEQLSKKQDAAYEQMTADEIRAELAKLDD